MHSPTAKNHECHQCEISDKYLIEYGYDKCNLLISGKQSEEEIKLNNEILAICQSYKYLGLKYNSKGNLDEQIKHLKGKVEAAYQTITFITQNPNISSLGLKAIWTLVDTCILPTILYAAETLFMTKKDKEKYNSIFTQILKRIMGVATSMPNTAILIETGYISIEKMIEKRRILFLRRLKNLNNESLAKNIIYEENNIWKAETQDIMQKLEIQDVNEKKEKFKKRVNEAQAIEWIEEVHTESSSKSKVNYLISNSNRNILQRPDYMNQMSRNQARNILIYRTRMVKVKCNYKKMFTDTTCRWCKKKEETQKHILEECEEFPVDRHNLKEKDIFSNNLEALKECSIIINEINEECEK